MADTPESAKDLKGRVKEGVGDVTGDKDLKKEGKSEQAGEKLKAGVDKIADAAKSVVDR